MFHSFSEDLLIIDILGIAFGKEEGMDQDANKITVASSLVTAIVYNCGFTEATEIFGRTARC